jgi:nicotinamidase-related amidase
LGVRHSQYVLLVIDVQDRLIDTISEHRSVVRNIKALIKAAQVLGVPILASEQAKLGETLPELKSLLPNLLPFRKLSFSCCRASGFMIRLRNLRRRTVIVCGIETHICVLQTVLDLLKRHYRVQVVKDASSSHTLTDHETAIERMKDSGAVVTTTEAAIYELTESAGTGEFKRILEIVKERRGTISQ